MVYNVDSKGNFTAKLPIAVKEALEEGEVRADNLHDCEQNFREALERFEKSQTTKRRVILYKVQATAWIWNDSEERCVYNEKEISFTDGAAVSIQAAVFDECEIKSPDGSVRYRYDEVVDTKLRQRAVRMCARFNKFPHARHEHQLPYTPEREEFFIKLSRGLESLVLQLNQLNDITKALAFADSGRLALPETT